MNREESDDITCQSICKTVHYKVQRKYTCIETSLVGTRAAMSSIGD